MTPNEQTTAITANAVEMARYGKSIVVIVYDTMAASLCTSRAITQLQKLGVDCVYYSDSAIRLRDGKAVHSHAHIRLPDSTLRFVPIGCSSIDWQRRPLSYNGRPDRVLVDPLAIDRRLAELNKSIATLESEKAALLGYKQSEAIGT